jgi:hypothetical protein
MNSQSSSYSADPGLSGRPAATQFNAVHSPAEYVKELARYNEEKDRANGNYNDSNPDADADPDESAQHREHARSSPSSQLPSLTSANPNGPASQNSVPQTPQNLVLQTLPQPLNDEFLIEFVSFNHSAQLDQIRRLDREQRDRRTSDERCVEIAVFLRKLEVVDPVEEQQHQQQQQQRLLQHQQQQLLLAYNKYLIPNSEFARVHQQMIQEQQQQQLAQEEAAKLKAALAKAIGWAIAHQPGVAPTPVLAAAQQQPGEGSLVVPLQHGEGSLVVPQQPGDGTPVVPQLNHSLCLQLVDRR